MAVYKNVGCTRFDSGLAHNFTTFISVRFFTWILIKYLINKNLHDFSIIWISADLDDWLIIFKPCLWKIQRYMKWHFAVMVLVNLVPLNKCTFLCNLLVIYRIKWSCFFYNGLTLYVQLQIILGFCFMAHISSDIMYFPIFFFLHNTPFWVFFLSFKLSCWILFFSFLSLWLVVS